MEEDFAKILLGFQLKPNFTRKINIIVHTYYTYNPQHICKFSVHSGLNLLFKDFFICTSQ